MVITLLPGWKSGHLDAIFDLGKLCHLLTLHLNIHNSVNRSKKANHSYDPSFPKYSSTNAFFCKSNNTFSISSVVGIFGGINISGVKNGIYAAAARACTAAGESPFTSKPVAGCVEGGETPSFLGRFETSSDASPLAISASSSGGCLRFGCVVSGVDESVTCGDVPSFPCCGRWSFGIGSSVSSPSDSRKFVYASAQSTHQLFYGFSGKGNI